MLNYIRDIMIIIFYILMIAFGIIMLIYSIRVNKLIKMETRQFYNEGELSDNEKRKNKGN